MRFRVPPPPGSGRKPRAVISGAVTRPCAHAEGDTRSASAPSLSVLSPKEQKRLCLGARNSLWPFPNTISTSPFSTQHPSLRKRRSAEPTTFLKTEARPSTLVSCVFHRVLKRLEKPPFLHLSLIHSLCTIDEEEDLHEIHSRAILVVSANRVRNARKRSLPCVTPSPCFSPPLCFRSPFRRQRRTSRRMRTETPSSPSPADGNTHSAKKGPDFRGPFSFSSLLGIIPTTWC